MFFIDNGVHYIKDQTPYYERDNYDFLLKNNRKRLLADAKTRTAFPGDKHRQFS